MVWMFEYFWCELGGRGAHWAGTIGAWRAGEGRSM